MTMTETAPKPMTRAQVQGVEDTIFDLNSGANELREALSVAAGCKRIKPSVRRDLATLAERLAEPDANIVSVALLMSEARHKLFYALNLRAKTATHADFAFESEPPAPTRETMLQLHSELGKAQLVAGAYKARRLEWGEVELSEYAGLEAQRMWGWTAVSIAERLWMAAAQSRLEALRCHFASRVYAEFGYDFPAHLEGLL